MADRRRHYNEPPVAIANGVVNVAAVGVRVNLPNVPCLSISIKAHPGNAGLIYLGDNAVAAANGYQLNPGDAVDLAIDNANRFWVDAANANDKISYICVN